MPVRVLLVVPIALLVSACQVAKTTPTAPTVILTSEPTTAAPAPPPPPAQENYPGDGPGVIAYVMARYPEKLVAGVSHQERVANMEFLRDRVIEVGKCGGLTLGWNMKRGGPEKSIDFIAERLADGSVIGHDIAFDYDNTGRPLEMYWGGGDFPSYREYPQPACN